MANLLFTYDGQTCRQVQADLEDCESLFYNLLAVQSKTKGEGYPCLFGFVNSSKPPKFLKVRLAAQQSGSEEE